MKTLRTWLADHGTTIAELAEEIGVSQSAVSNWLNGYNGPQRSSLISLSRVTGLSIEALLDITPINTTDAIAGETPKSVMAKSTEAQS